MNIENQMVIFKLPDNQEKKGFHSFGQSANF